MGPSPSNFNVMAWNPSTWVVEKQNGYCVLLKNKQTGQTVEEYDMLPKGDITIQEQLEFYEYRKNQNKHLVKVVGIMKGDSAGLCTGKDYYKIYTERIPFRLTEVDYLTFPEALMVIRDSLIGYDDIKDSYFGSLKVTNQMIGFTPEGEVKVWINEQFKSNTPDRKHIMKGYGNSLLLITQIFAIVQQSMADKNFPQSFRMEMNKLDDTLTYQKAIKFIEDYATKSGIDIPNRLNIVRTSLKPQQINHNIPIAEPYSIDVYPVPVSHQKKQIIQDVRVQVVPQTVIHGHMINNLPPPTNIPVRSVPQPLVSHNIHSNPQYNITQRKQVRVNNQFNGNIGNVNGNIINGSLLHPQLNHGRNYSDVVPFEVSENGHAVKPIDHFHHESKHINRQVVHQRLRQMEPIRSIQKPNHSVQVRIPSHKNQPIISARGNRNQSQQKFVNNYTYQNPINRTLPPQSQINQPMTPQHLNNNYSSSNLLLKNRASPEYYNKSSTFFEQDTLNQRIDALTANIANMHKQLQQSTRKNNGYY